MHYRQGLLTKYCNTLFQWDQFSFNQLYPTTSPTMHFTNTQGIAVNYYAAGFLNSWR